MNETNLSLLKGQHLKDLTNLITEGKTIVLVIPPAIILIEKFSYGYEMNIINRTDNSWEIMKHDDYSLKVTLSAIYQSPQIKKTLIYLCECRNDAKKEYIKIADVLLLADNKGKEVITLENDMEDK